MVAYTVTGPDIAPSGGIYMVSRTSGYIDEAIFPHILVRAGEADHELYIMPTFRH